MNSVALVGYGAALRAATTVLTRKRTYFWFGLARQEHYDRKKYFDATVDDLQLDTTMTMSGEIEEKQLVKAVHWFAKTVRTPREANPGHFKRKR